MLALILYIVGALAFIAAVVLLSFIPNKAVKVTVLILFCLLFTIGMMFLMFRASGQPSLGSMFDALSPSGQAQQVSTNIGGNSGGLNPVQTQDQMQSTATTAAPMPTANTALPSAAPTPIQQTTGASGVTGTWTDPADPTHRIEMRADGTCTIYYPSGPEEMGTYTFDVQTNTGMMMGDKYSLWYDPQMDMIMYIGGTLTREGAADVPDDTFSILRMWYEEVQGEYRLEFSPDGLLRYITPDDVFAGMYTFDAAAGEGQIDILGEVYGISYSFDSKTLSFDGISFMCIPPGPEVNRILGMWYEQGEGVTLLEFFPDGTVKFHEDIDPDVGTYILDDAAGHGDVMMLGYTYELIYDADDDLISFEGGLYSRIPW